MATYSPRNIESLFGLIGATAGKSLIRENQVEAIRLPETVWPDIIFRLTLKGGTANNDLQQLRKRVKQGELPGMYMADPSESHKPTLELLDQYNLNSGYWTAMYYDLKQTLPEFPRPDMEVKPVQTKQELGQWYGLVENVLMGEKALDHSIFDPLRMSEGVDYYLGYDQGTPVSSSLTYIHEGELGIYCISTHPDYQGKGFGRTITFHALQQAQKNNCHTAVLQATIKGGPVYASMGFIDAGPIRLFRLDQ